VRHSRLAGFFVAIPVRAVLNLLPSGRPAKGRGRGDGRRPGDSRGGSPARPAVAETLVRPGRAVPALVLLGIGAITMLVFESTVTRVIGVLALFGFVIAGVFAIADPRWLAGAPELGRSGDDRVPQARQNG
jgi:hypothetical protein